MQRPRQASSFLGRTYRRLESEIGRLPIGAVSILVWGVASLMMALPLISTFGDVDSPWGAPWHLRALLVAVAGLCCTLIWVRKHDKSVVRTIRWKQAAFGVLVLVSYTAFVGNYATLGTGDTQPILLTAVSIADRGELNLSKLTTPGRERPYWVIEREGELLSAFPIGTSIVATPYFALARAFGLEAKVLAADPVFEKHVASLMCCASVLLFALAMARDLGNRQAVLLGAMLALATPFLPTLSQALWSATGATFCIALMLWILSRWRTSMVAVVVAGCAVGLAFHSRPTSVFLVLLALPYLASRGLPLRLGFSFASGVAIAASVLLNLRVYGHALGGYGLLNSDSFSRSLEGSLGSLVGVLFSPSRGLAVFLPALAFAIAQGPPTDRDDRLRWWCNVIPICAYVAVTSLYSKWWGGYSLGPRLLAEVSIPSVMLISYALATRGAVRIVATALLIWQFALGMGLSQSSRAWEWNSVVAVDNNPGILWSLRNSQLAAIHPRWTFREPARYVSPSVWSRLVHEDVEPIPIEDLVNSRYDAIPESARVDLTNLYLPRLAEESASISSGGALRIIGPGRQNALRVCSWDDEIVVPVGMRSVNHFILLAQWRGVDDRFVGLAPAGEIHVVMKGGGTFKRVLVEGWDVFDVSKESRRIHLPSTDSILAGTPASRDALVLQEINISNRQGLVRELRIKTAGTANPGCLYILAVSSGVRRQSGDHAS